MNEQAARAALVRLSRSLFERGYSVGSAGNISVAVEDGLLITPTNSCLGFLDEERICKLDRTGANYFRCIDMMKPRKRIIWQTNNKV